MLGYIVPERPELKVKEYELYKGYYCGICKSVGLRFGQIPRMVLSYDSVFLALVLEAVEDAKENLSRERCPVHPVERRIVVRGPKAVDYSADIMLLLARYKLKDDLQDERSVKAGAGMLLLKNSFRKLMKTHEKKGIILETCLGELAETEKNRRPSMDEAAEPFARLLGELFVPEYLEGREEAEALRKIGWHLGKWIYLIDAFDDLNEDSISGSYNPLLLQFGWKDEEADAFRDRTRERVEFSLMCCLTALSDAWIALKKEKNKELIENIIYFGLRRKTEQVLLGIKENEKEESNTEGNSTHGKSI